MSLTQYAKLREFDVHVPDYVESDAHIWKWGICSGRKITVKARSERAAIRIAIAVGKKQKGGDGGG